MGLAKNQNVAVTLGTGEAPILEKLQIVSPHEAQYTKAFVFAQVRSREEDALSYVVIGRNEEEGAALQRFFQSLADEHPLRNVRDAFLGVRSLGGDDFVTLSSCCNDSKNVAVLFAGEIDDKKWDSVTLLDRYVHAEFDKDADVDPLNWPVTALDIQTKPHKGAKYCVCK